MRQMIYAFFFLTITGRADSVLAAEADYSFRANGSHYTTLLFSKVANTVTVDIAGFQLAQAIAKDVFLARFTFPVDACKVRPDDRQIVRCSPRSSYVVSFQDENGSALPADTAGKVHWINFWTLKRRGMGADPTFDWNEFHFAVEFSAEKVPGLIATIEDGSNRMPSD
jgi:hypothetical protein